MASGSSLFCVVFCNTEFLHDLYAITGIEIIMLNEYSFLEFKVDSLFERERVVRSKGLYFN